MIQMQNIKILTGNTLKVFSKDSMTVTDKDGEETVLEADAVVTAVGLKANRVFRDQLDAKMHPVGDCNKPRKIYDAIHEGYVAAMSV